MGFPRGVVKSTPDADYLLIKIQITAFQCQCFTRTATS